MSGQQAMLPGLRFLAATVLLTISIVVFALGAAALLRSTHGEFTGVQFTRATQEPLFAQRWDTSLPTIALLRADPSPGETPAAPAQQPDAVNKAGAPDDEPSNTAGGPIADAGAAEPPASEPALPQKTASAAPASVTDAPVLPQVAPPPERLASLPAALVDVPEVKKEQTARQKSLRRARSKARRHFTRRYRPKVVIQKPVVTPEIFLPTNTF
jgi:hypothetical protein